MTAEDWVPDACTLPSAERPLRLTEFDTLFASVRSVSRPHRGLLQLVISSDDEATARDLAARESECCSFFSFTFTSRDPDVVMEIGVPPDHVTVLDAVEAMARNAKL
jgi:hypothetical protein